MTTTHFLGIASLSCYLVCSLLYLFSVLARRDIVSRWAGPLFGCAFLLHTLTTLVLSFEAPVPILEDRSSFFLWTSWVVAALFLFVRRRTSYPVVGAFFLPTISLFMAGSSVLIHYQAAPVETVPLVLFGLHIVPALISEICMVFALIVSSLYLIRDRSLKRKSEKAVALRGPSLDGIDVLNRRLVFVGFISMTFAVISGSLWAVSRGEILHLNDFSIFSAFLTWGLLAFLLLSRAHLGWSSRRISKITLVGTAVFFVSLFCAALIGGGAMHV